MSHDNKRKQNFDVCGSGESSKAVRKYSKNEGLGVNEYREYFASFNAFERHKILVNQYLLYCPGATESLKRDDSKDKNDWDVLRENHRFLWEDDVSIETWGKKLAKKYYDKLFKEYCICDLSRYEDGLVGMRWRTEKEVMDGRGQFVCGAKRCDATETLRTWEMNFGYVEHGTKKNALVKLRLCIDCSYKVNYKHQRKEITKPKSKRQKTDENELSKESEDEQETDDKDGEEETNDKKDVEKESVWKITPTEDKNREEEFQDYLQDLFV